MGRNEVLSPLGESNWVVTLDLPSRPDGRRRRWSRRVRGTEAEVAQILNATHDGADRDETNAVTHSPVSFPLQRDVAKMLEARARESGRSVGDELRVLLAIQSIPER